MVVGKNKTRVGSSPQNYSTDFIAFIWVWAKWVIQKKKMKTNKKKNEEQKKKSIHRSSIVPNHNMKMHPARCYNNSAIVRSANVGIGMCSTWKILLCRKNVPGTGHAHELNSLTAKRSQGGQNRQRGSLNYRYHDAFYPPEAKTKNEDENVLNRLYFLNIPTLFSQIWHNLQTNAPVKLSEG